MVCVSCLVILYLGAFVSVFFGALRVAILVNVLRSWVRFSLPFGLDRFLSDVTEPVLGPIRRALPPMGGMDFSPFVALLVLQVIESLIRGLLPPIL